jgi:hypothetical protein
LVLISLLNVVTGYPEYRFCGKFRVLREVHEKRAIRMFKGVEEQSTNEKKLLDQHHISYR